jgi:hypothetical protein
VHGSSKQAFFSVENLLGDRKFQTYPVPPVHLHLSDRIGTI